MQTTATTAAPRAKAMTMRSVGGVSEPTGSGANSDLMAGLLSVGGTCMTFCAPTFGGANIAQSNNILQKARRKNTTPLRRVSEKANLAATNRMGLLIWRILSNDAPSVLGCFPNPNQNNGQDISRKASPVWVDPGRCIGDFGHGSSDRSSIEPPPP